MGGRWAAFLYRSILLVTDNLIIKAAQLTRIEVDAYNSWKNLMEYLKKVLDQLGSKYIINFV